MRLFHVKEVETQSFSYPIFQYLAAQSGDRLITEAGDYLTVSAELADVATLFHAPSTPSTFRTGTLETYPQSTEITLETSGTLDTEDGEPFESESADFVTQIFHVR